MSRTLTRWIATTVVLVVWTASTAVPAEAPVEAGSQPAAGASPPAQNQTPPDRERIGNARDTLAKWVETQQVISREEEDWRLGREVLEQRIALMEGELASLEEKIEQTRDAIGEIDGKREELIADNESLHDAQGALESAIRRLEDKTKKLLVAIPEPLSQRVAPLSRRLPEDPESTELSLSTRFQNVIGVLNAINKFNADITLTNEVRTLPDGSSAEVRALYLGLGQAYYVTPNGRSAGVGRPSADGWDWVAADELAPEITRAIAIFQNEEQPAYVPLTVTIQ
jgi:hypothetical protein